MTNSEEKSLPKKIAEDIIAFILEENLQPGDKLPNETVLCERLNVGRSSLREAMEYRHHPAGIRHLCRIFHRCY